MHRECSTRSWLLGVIVVLVLLPAGIVLADELPHPTSPEALKHLAAGKKHYDVMEWNQAIEEYKAGARAEESPVFDYNLGQAYRQAHDYRAAIWHYQRFLKSYSQAGARTESVKKLIAEMQAELDQRASKEPPTDAISAPPITTASNPTVAQSLPREPSQPPPPVVAEPTAWYADTMGWALVGTGVVAGGIAGYLWWDAASLNDQANRETDQQRRRQLQDQASNRNVAGTIVGVAGLGLLVAGGIKLAIRPHEPSKNTVLTLHFSGDVISVAGRF